MKQTTYPLLLSQQQLAGFAEILPVLEALSEIVQISYSEKVDEQHLLEALHYAEKNIPACRVHIHRQEDGSYVQYICEEEPEAIEIVEMPSCSMEERDELFREWTRESFPGTFTDRQLYTFRILHHPDGKRILFFCFQHFIMDGFAAVQLLQLANDAYRALVNGSALPPPAPAPWKLIEEQSAFLHSERREKELRAMLKVFETEPRFTSLNGPDAPEFIEGVRYGKWVDPTQMLGGDLQYTLPTKLVEGIYSCSEILNVSPKSFFSVTAKSYLGRICETEDVTICHLSACRATKLEKQCGFNLVNANTIRLVFPESVSFRDAVIEAYRVQNDALRHYRVFNDDMLALVYDRYQTPQGCGYFSFVLSYFPPVFLEPGSLDFTARFVNNGWAHFPINMQIIPENGNGGLCCAYSYSTGYTKLESIEKFHAFLLKFLELGIAQPEKSLGALIDESL